MKRAILTALIFITALTAFFALACGDDDDDNDDNDDEDGDDDDSSGDECLDAAYVSAQTYCEDYGMDADTSAGLDYSYAECDIYCGGGEAYYTDCDKTVCICCI